MKQGDLVRFERKIVGELLDDETDNWKDWIGVVIRVQCEDYCKVQWHDGRIRREFIEYLEVLNETR
jgi:hypothetical protein